MQKLRKISEKSDGSGTRFRDEVDDGVVSSSSGVEGLRERAENEANQAVFCSSIVVA